MSLFFHAIKTLLRRFWPSVLVFWVVSITASLWAARLPSSFPDLPLTVLEVLAWLWLSLRILLSESVFRTQGGWEVRPLGRGVAWTSRWGLYLVILLPPLILRAVSQSVALRWSFAQWAAGGAGDWWGLGAVVLAAGAVISIAGQISRRGWTARVMLGVAGVCAIVVLIKSPLTWRWMGDRQGRGSGSEFSVMPPGLAALIPPGDRGIEIYFGGGSPPEPVALRMIARLPARQGAEADADAGGARVRIEELEPLEEHLRFRLLVEGPVAVLESWKKDATVVALRYADGTWGWPRGYGGQRSAKTVLPGFATMNREESGELLSPRIYPWTTAGWEELLKGAELFVLIPTAAKDPAPLPLKDYPVVPSAIGDREKTIPLPNLTEQASPQEIQAAVRAALDQIRITPYDYPSLPDSILARAGAAAIPAVLESLPFGEKAWSNRIRGFLIEYANEAQRPAMRQYLEQYPEVADVFIAKGWKEEAIPVLCRFLEEGRPLGTASLKALAALRDPALARGLWNQALLGDDGYYENFALVEALKDHPGLDWKALVLKACRASARKWGETSESWLEFAAPLGDRITFHEQAAAWLLKPKPPSREKIQAWIAESAWSGESAEFPAWLRANFDRLQWDAALARWDLPGKSP